MVLFATAIADKRGHDFDQAEEGYLHAFEHINALACIQQSDVLGCRYDDCTRYKELLTERHLHITGAWW